MMQRVELLVHTGAPSSRLDEDRFKAQAKSYLCFDGLPVDDQTGSDFLDTAPAHHRDHDTEGVLPSAGSTTLTQITDTKFLDDTQLAISALESQLFTSSMVAPQASFTSTRPRANESRYRVPPPSNGSNKPSDGNSHIRETYDPGDASNQRRLEQTDPQNARTDGGDVSLSADVSFTSYLRSPELGRGRKRRRADLSNERAPPYHHSSLALDLEYSARHHPSQGHTFSIIKGASLPRSGLQGSPHQDCSSEMPTSYSLSDITSEDSRARQRLSQRSVSDPGPMANTMPRANFPRDGNGRDYEGEKLSPKDGEDSTSAHASLSTNHDRLRIFEQHNNATEADGRTGSAYLPAAHTDDKHVEDRADTGIQQTLSASIPVISSGAQGFLSLPESIRPRSPEPGIGTFSTHITQSLRFLAEDSEISKAYRPLEVVRELQPLERGHWFFDASSWPAQVQIDFWEFLTTMIGGGEAGWGVWCTRNEERAPSPSSHYDDPSASKSTTSLPSAPNPGRIKVFCWGEVVSHVYLMLYVASKSRVRRMGLKWIDASDRVVVRMRDR